MLKNEKRMTVREAATHLGYKATWTIYDLIRRGKIRAHRRGPEDKAKLANKPGRRGGDLFFYASELDRWMNAGEK